MKKKKERKRKEEMEKHQQITIQIGSYSNFVGSHFWNIQDDILSDVCEEENEEIKDSNSSINNQTIEYQRERLFQIKENNKITPRVVIIEQR